MSNTNNVRYMDDYRSTWKEIYCAEDKNVTIQIFHNERTRECDIVQVNNEGETSCVRLTKIDVMRLTLILTELNARKV